MKVAWCHVCLAPGLQFDPHASVCTHLFTNSNWGALLAYLCGAFSVAGGSSHVVLYSF